MSLKGRINRLVRTLSDKKFYNEKNTSPGEFNPAVVTAIENFRDFAVPGRDTRVIINAFRVFDNNYFPSVERNCNRVTDAIEIGINKILEKYSPLLADSQLAQSSILTEATA